MTRVKAKWRPMTRSTYAPLTPEQIAEHIRIAWEEHGIRMGEDEVRTAIQDDEVWINNRYQASVTYLSDRGREGWVHLSIKKNTKGWVHDWRELQQIKTDVLGPEREALELYPAESRVVDTANQYHLWVMPEGDRSPLGWDAGRYVTDVTGESGARQRPR